MKYDMAFEAAFPFIIAIGILLTIAVGISMIVKDAGPTDHTKAVEACINMKGIPSFNERGYIQECKFYLLESPQQ